jgi:hypothetical protein
MVIITCNFQMLKEKFLDCGALSMLAGVGWNGVEMRRRRRTLGIANLEAGSLAGFFVLEGWVTAIKISTPAVKQKPALPFGFLPAGNQSGSAIKGNAIFHMNRDRTCD